eukprot:Sdes_comp20789_c1_seq2m16959
MQFKTLVASSLLNGGTESKMKASILENGFGAGIPELLPQGLQKTTVAEFTKCVRNRMDSLRESGWTILQLDNARDQFRKLIHAEKYLNEYSSFENAWIPYKDRFPDLKRYIDIVATPFAANPSVEGEYSLLKHMEKAVQARLGNLGLNGVLQSPQVNHLINTKMPFISFPC